MPERFCRQDGHDRREWQGSGGPIRERARRLLANARGGRACRWEGVGRRAGPGIDQLEAEQLLWGALEAGLVIIRERRNRRGDWETYQWRLTDAGEGVLAPVPEAPDVAGYLAYDDDPRHPVLTSIRRWLTIGKGSTLTTRLGIAIGDELRAGRLPLERILSIRLTGRSKALRLEDHRSELEEALGFPIEQLVRRAGRAVLLSGPLKFHVGTVEVDARGIVPWLALPPETVDAMEDLRLEADRLLTVENLVPFEEECRRGLGPRTVALYLGGFPGELEGKMLERLVRAGVRWVDHWGDMDLGGLRILRHVATLVSIDVRPYRMDPALLERMPTQPLTENDRVGLADWLLDPAAPVRDLASALLARGRKAEQEGWFLVA